MNLHSLKPAKGSVKKGKRIARGQGSGRGGTSTKGHKGANQEQAIVDLLGLKEVRCHFNVEYQSLDSKILLA